MKLEELFEKAPSAGLSKERKSEIVKKAKKGEDIGKKGKGFEKVEKAAKESGAKDPKAVAAAQMWKQLEEIHLEGKKTLSDQLKDAQSRLEQIRRQRRDPNRNVPSSVELDAEKEVKRLRDATSHESK